MGRDRLGCFNVPGVLAAAEPGAAPDRGRMTVSRDNKLLQRPRQVSFGVRLPEPGYKVETTHNAARKSMRNEATPHPVPQLETTHLVLRALVPGDADDIFAYAADPDMAQYTLWSAHTTLEDSRQFIA